MNKEKVIQDFILNHKSCWKSLMEDWMHLDKDGYPVEEYDIFQEVCFIVTPEEVQKVHLKMVEENLL